MSREVRRVPLDFDWPLGQVWEGYVMPDHSVGSLVATGDGHLIDGVVAVSELSKEEQ